MPTNEIVSEVLRITSTGIDETSAKLKVFGDDLDQAAKRQKILQDLMGDNTYAKHVQDVNNLNRAYRQDLAIMENRTAAMAAQSGVAARHGLVMQQLARQGSIVTASIRNQATAADLASGAYLRDARAISAVRREAEILNKQAGFQMMVAEHGQFGAVIKSNEQELRFLGSTAMGALNSVSGMSMGLMRAGLSGTAEGYRLSLAFERLGQSMAGIIVPVVNSISRGLGMVTGWFRSMTGDQQKWILGFTLAGAAMGPLIKMGSLLLTTFRGIGAIAGTITSALGMGALGMGTVSALTAGGIHAGTHATSATSAAVGSRMITGMSTAAAAPGGLLTAEAAIASRTMARRSAGRFMLRRVVPIVAAGELLHTAFRSEPREHSYYGGERALGHDRFDSVVRAVYHSVAEYIHTAGSILGLSSGEEYRRSLMERYPRIDSEPARTPPPTPRTDVHPLTVDELEGGESARRVQHAVLLHGAGSGGEGEAGIDDLIEFLRSTLNPILERLTMPVLPPAGH